MHRGPQAVHHSTVNTQTHMQRSSSESAFSLGRNHFESIHRTVNIPVDDTELEGELRVPSGAAGIVIFAHGSGSSRHSPRNQFVAGVIRESQLGTLLFDLLTPAEEAEDNVTRALRFDIGLLASRLAEVARWVRYQPETKALRIGYFGSSTGGGAALVAAAQLKHEIDAVVSRGGRPDLAGHHLPHVEAPTLLIVGGRDQKVLELNKDALRQLIGKKELRVVAGATHLFEEPGKLEEVAEMAAGWFRRYLGNPTDNGEAGA
jgi:dienelactone hydrolase